MQMKFTKMQGLGNDFVVIDAVTQNVRISASMVRRLSNRTLGIGCDQVLVIEPPSEPNIDFNYRIFNQSGDEVEQSQMCGMSEKSRRRRKLRVFIAPHFVRPKPHPPLDGSLIFVTYGSVTINIPPQGASARAYRGFFFFFF